MNVTTWLCAQEESFASISDEERALAADFAMLWTYFEAKGCGNQANSERLEQLAQHLILEDDFIYQSVAQAAAYFRERYVEEGKLSYRFPHLGFPNNKYLPIVTDYLLHDRHSEHEDLVLCLCVIYRYRNNLFHGNKWAYYLRDQKTNFETAITLLTELTPAASRLNLFQPTED